MRLTSSQCPIILAIPPFLLQTTVKTSFLSLLPQVPNGFLGVIVSPVLVTARHRLRSAIVVSVGARFAWVAAVKDLKLREANKIWSLLENV